MKTRYLFAPLLLVMLLCGCAVNNNMYHWGDYSSTLYNWKKDATDERGEEHFAELARVVEESEAKGIRVPPGIYCEYGLMLVQAGNMEDGRSFMNKEAEVYPESRKFVDFALKQCEGAVQEEVGDEKQ